MSQIEPCHELKWTAHNRHFSVNIETQLAICGDIIALAFSSVALRATSNKPYDRRCYVLWYSRLSYIA